ncbi:MAG: UDP-N-acetylmuramoylalanyl-D-glutamyl-2,6-diaminopimelate--D-alanyl-D-alanine ligase [Acidimicrobiales bacterium]
MTAVVALVVVVGVVSAGLADFRWLRVAQREHYLSGSVTTFALRWWVRLGPNRLLAVAAVLGTVLSPLSPFTALVGLVAIAVGPFRFPLRGRAPGPVVWTKRLRVVALVTVGLQVGVLLAGISVGLAVPAVSIGALLAPLVVDAALLVLLPFEERKAEGFVRQAGARLGQVAPLVVAITGSYGKTTTKAYTAHLIAGSRTVVPTPASFNNRAGLSRAINEHLIAGTEVFIAEMGTYGPREIAEMCEWCRPRIAAITAIGPVHLERFGSEDAIVRAKSEIFGHAEIAVLNVDDPRLANVADELEARGLRVVRASGLDPSAEVSAIESGPPDSARLVVTVGGRRIADVPSPDAVATNVAVAVALAVAADVPVDRLGPALETLPSVANRRTTALLSTGATAIDDTFNSNPAGCRAALATLVRLSRPGAKRIVVTPGMVELGDVQATANEAFAAEAAGQATHVMFVGFTNRAALLRGAKAAPPGDRAEVLVADTHDRAVEWVRAHTGEGDVVLYENQLPDHYP